uniref:G protein-coupled receptor n=1 Tax=Pristionchus pacificus TaxID=54126 RepID=A0A8R1Z0S5_PRIPA
MGLLSQQLAIFIAVFVLPISGAYQTIDFTGSPYVIHSQYALRLVASNCTRYCFDSRWISIQMGTSENFYPRLTQSWLWIGMIILIKIIIVNFRRSRFDWFAIESDGDENASGKGICKLKVTNTETLVQWYPNAVPTFDAYKSFVVYDFSSLSGCSNYNKSNEFRYTKDALAFRNSTWLAGPGYVTISLLMLHGPLTSIMTLILYELYRMCDEHHGSSKHHSLHNHFANYTRNHKPTNMKRPLFSQRYSSRSMGAFKLCLYQIVGMSLISQQCLLLGPIFALPIAYPNVVATFDSYKSFIVYDLKWVTGFVQALMIGVFNLTVNCGVVIAIIFRLLRNQQNKISSATRRMHTQFVQQLCFQALVPFTVFVCPQFVLLFLILFEFQFNNNRELAEKHLKIVPGYIVLGLLMLHGPLTSLMTIALYDPYTKV